MKRNILIKKLNTISIYNEAHAKYSQLNKPLLLTSYLIKIKKIKIIEAVTKIRKKTLGDIYILKNNKSNTLQIVFKEAGDTISEHSPIRLNKILHRYKGNNYLGRLLRDYCSTNMINSNKFENTASFFVSLERFAISNKLIDISEKLKVLPMKYYAVRVGKVIGIYFLWKDCEAQVKGFSGAEYKSFTSIMDAVEYIAFEASEHK